MKRNISLFAAGCCINMITYVSIFLLLTIIPLCVHTGNFKNRTTCFLIHDKNYSVKKIAVVNGGSVLQNTDCIIPYLKLIPDAINEEKVFKVCSHHYVLRKLGKPSIDLPLIPYSCCTIPVDSMMADSLGRILDVDAILAIWVRRCDIRKGHVVSARLFLTSNGKGLWCSTAATGIKLGRSYNTGLFVINTDTQNYSYNFQTHIKTVTDMLKNDLFNR